MPKVNKNILIGISGAMWTLVGIFLIKIAIFWLLSPLNTTILSILGVMLVLGILVYAVGFFVRLKAFNDLKNNYNVSKEKIAKNIMANGIYSYTRHPLYLGTLLIYLGFCLMIFSKAGVILYFIFLVPLFFIRIREEEKEFAENAEYKKYKKRTSRLVPFVY